MKKTIFFKALIASLTAVAAVAAIKNLNSDEAKPEVESSDDSKVNLSGKELTSEMLADSINKVEVTPIPDPDCSQEYMGLYNPEKFKEKNIYYDIMFS